MSTMRIQGNTVISGNIKIDYTVGDNLPATNSTTNQAQEKYQEQRRFLDPFGLNPDFDNN